MPNFNRISELAKPKKTIENEDKNRSKSVEPRSELNANYSMMLESK